MDVCVGGQEEKGNRGERAGQRHRERERQRGGAERTAPLLRAVIPLLVLVQTRSPPAAQMKVSSTPELR